MKQILILIIITLSFSCTEKVVQLPATTNKTITEVLDVSPVYMFYDEETDSVVFNRKNMISSTNWLVNIDKRLTLKQILPHLQYLQEKRHGDGMHKNKNACNYFTCNNTDLKSLSFIEFTDVAYYNEASLDFYTRKENHINSDQYITISVFKDSLDIDFFNQGHSLITKSNIQQLKKHIEVNLIKEGEVFITSDLNEDLSFQNYINYKSELLKIDFDNVVIRKEEFIHN